MVDKHNGDIVTKIDLANWMGNLDESKKCSPINSLAIPGSHDSMTYGISRTSKIAPDAEPIVKQLAKYFKPVVSVLMYGWSVTQNLNVKMQLDLGIRYLDFRVATKEKDPNFYFVHGMYGQNVSAGLVEIAEFLKEHEKEIVILDFQHFYSFNDSDHNRLVYLISSVFGDKLCPRPFNISSITLNEMLEHKYQVIVIYRNSFIKDLSTYWTSNMWPTPWPNTMNVSDMLKFVDEHLINRPKNAGFVSQCVLTPQTSTVILNPFSGVKRKCAIPVSRVIIPWIQEQSPPINVAIADFVEMNDANFPLSVVSLNYT